EHGKTGIAPWRIRTSHRRAGQHLKSLRELPLDDGLETMKEVVQLRRVREQLAILTERRRVAIVVGEHLVVGRIELVAADIWHVADGIGRRRNTDVDASHQAVVLAEGQCEAKEEKIVRTTLDANDELVGKWAAKTWIDRRLAVWRPGTDARNQCAALRRLKDPVVVGIEPAVHLSLRRG